MAISYVVMEPSMKHKYSTEQLYHFICAKCSQWWSIGDYINDVEPLHCPHCGQEAHIEPIVDEEEDFSNLLCK